VSVNCSVPSSVARSPVIVGSEGRYMSIDSGPKAVSPPSSKAYLTRLGKLCCCSSVGGAVLARTAVWVAMKCLPPVVVPLAATHHTVENIPLPARGDRNHTRLLPLLAGSTVVIHPVWCRSRVDPARRREQYRRTGPRPASTGPSPRSSGASR